MDAEVLVVGCGPVGALLAALLGLRGVRVLVVERAAAPIGEPRAIATDDEVLRVLLRLPGGADLVAGMDLLQRVLFTDAAGRRLTGIGLGESALRLPRLAFFDQPALEAGLLRLLATLPTVRVEVATELVTLRQDDTGTTATLRRGATDREVRAAWAVGADGAHSTVREALHVPFHGRGGGARWVVLDVDSAAPLQGLPHMRFVCDPAGPWLSLPRPGGHRVEAALAPGTSDAEATSPATVRALLSRVVAPGLLDDGSVRVRRAAVYDYAARQAARWRVGRVLLVGDAAHTMPPFAGQGLSAGLRDADELSWRLALAVRGLAGPRPLDAWERERRAHVEAMTRLSLLVGSIVEARSPRRVAVRDAALRALDTAPLVATWWRAGGRKPPARIPHAGVTPLLPARSTGEGLLLPRPRVRDVRGRLLDLDSLLGEDHCLLGLMCDPATALAAVPVDDRDRMRERGLSLLTVFPLGGRPVLARAAGVVEGTQVAEDVDGTLLRQLQRLHRALRLRAAATGRANGGLVALVRPDRHLAGAVLVPDLAGAARVYLQALDAGAPAVTPVAAAPLG